jgi:Cdc6-like AAA superfamily ATPase
MAHQISRIPVMERGDSRFFWFYGIPGAGKTVLLSHVIEDIKASCETDVACTYYYCYFGRAQNEAPHLLRWVINQLSRLCQFIPDQLVNSFRSREEPSTAVLVKSLSELLGRFKVVYLLVDALDESLEKSKLLHVLSTLVGPGFEKIRLVATSREEIDIKTAIGHISQNLSLSNPYVDEDIRIFVQNQLHVHPRLRGYPPDLQRKIETALVGGAKGMYVSGVLMPYFFADILQVSVGSLPNRHSR